jgi:hypothetical protein
VAVRREQVILDLEDNLTPGLARAAVAAGLLDRELKSLGGSSVKSGRDLDKTATATERVAVSSRRATPEVDRMSGRLNILADAALTLGPALIPLGAGAIPVLTAALAGLGASAGAIGVTVLAFKGLGDGLKALNTYQTAPTAENLQALRVEMEKMGSSGEHFVKFLDDLGPELTNLQRIARGGIFPGVEDGITDLLTRLPQVRRIVADLSDGMGDLAREGGAALAGDKFTAFFDYIESDARPTLEAFARSTGNVIEGVANMIVAFAPLSRDFTGGLEDATAAFARWSRGLDQNQSFQEFLAYVRESGPQVIDLLGALSGALAGLLHAAAPLGRAVLPALTSVARAFSLIANSPIGPALYTAIAALVAFNRVSSLTGRANASLQASFKKLGADTQTTSQKLSVLGARGGIVLAGAAAVGQLADSINRIDTSNLDRSLTALTFGDVTPTIDKVIDSIDQLDSKWNSIDLGEVVTVGGLFGDSSLDKFADNVDQVDQSLARLVESGQQAEAADLFQKITDLASAKGVDPADTAKRFDAYALALRNVASASGIAGQKSATFAGLIGGVRQDLNAAADGAQHFSDALAGLNGWLDKRQAIRDYRDSVSELGKALKNGFKPKDAEKIDAVGRSITQVASLIKDKATRTDFLAGARASLEELANKSGPKAKRQVDKLIAALDEYGVTEPKTPKLDADDKPARAKIRGVKGFMEQLVGHPYTAKVDADDAQARTVIRRTHLMLDDVGRQHPTPQVDVNPGNSFSILGSIAARLGSLHDRTISVTTISHSVHGGATPRGEYASGGYTGPGGKYEPAGIVHRGEVVLPQDIVRRDMAMLRSRYGHLPGFAAGGLVDRPTAGDLNTPLFNGEGPRYYRAAYKHNRPFALDPTDPSWPYQTGMTDALNRAFEKWVNTNQIPFDMRAKIVDYDMRGFWLKKRPKSWHAGDHFPDTWKTPYDTTFSRESKYATNDNPFYWRGDKLIDERTGQVIFASDGGTVPKGGAYRDRYPAMLAPGEEIVPNRYGQADAYRAALKASDIYTSRRGTSWAAATSGTSSPRRDGAAQGLKGLKKQLEAQQKAYDKAKTARDAAVSRRDSLSGTIQQSLMGDSIWDASSGSVWAAGAHGANTPQGAIAALNARTDRARRFIAALNTLKGKGVTGAALQEILSEGLEATEAMAASDATTLSTFAGAVNESTAALAAAGLAGGNAVEGANVAATQKRLDRLHDKLKDIQQEIKQANADNQNAQHKNAQDVYHAVNGAASNGHRRGR